jgi:hypothetical protein
MKVLVTGGRTFSKYSLLAKSLTEFHSINKISCLAHGGASGADTLSGQWARVNGVPVKVFKADWNKYGRAAGQIRNKQMFEEFAPDIIIAFPGGPGTQNMVKTGQKGKVPVLIVNYDD